MAKKNYIKEIINISWLSRWAGSYAFISCSCYGPQYYQSLGDILGISLSHVLFIHHQGTVRFFVSSDEFNRFGLELAKRAINNIDYVKEICQELKKNTDIILPLMKRMQQIIPTISEYQAFLIYFDRHLAYHNFVKKTPDFLAESALKKLLLYFQDARHYSETVYSESEMFFRGIAKLISIEVGYSDKLLACLTQAEFLFFLKNHQLPNQDILAARYQDSVLYFEDGKEIIVSGPEAQELVCAIDEQFQSTKEYLKGVSAYPGKVEAMVRIILDPHKKQTFNQGDILVTGMTRPEFMPYIKKASAIITDVGGILCHAAITAREFKIPCIVGTVTATKVLKNGKKIKLDATTGIVDA